MSSRDTTRWIRDHVYPWMMEHARLEHGTCHQGNIGFYFFFWQTKNYNFGAIQLGLEREVLGDKDPEDLVDVLDGGGVEGADVVLSLVPHPREGQTDQVENGHAYKKMGKKWLRSI